MPAAPGARAAQAKPQPQAQSEPQSQAYSGGVPAGAPANPADLVRDMVNNEIAAETATDSFWQFTQTTKKNGKTQVDQVVETPKGNLERITARNGQPLDAAESRQQVQHIHELVSHPAEWQRSQRSAQDDTKKANEFLRILPTAFRFRYLGEKDGVVDIEATPNPAFRPTARETEVFHHMTGNIRINLAQKRMVGINGRLTSPVIFGGGILGHLNEGGTFVVAQREVGPNHWELTDLNVHMMGKALIFKTISVEQQQNCANFKEVPKDITLEQAEKILTAPEPPSDEQAGSPAGAGPKKKRGA